MPDRPTTMPPAADPAPAGAADTPPRFWPLLLGWRQAAEYLGVSEAKWWRLRAAARLPLPVRLEPKGRQLWRLRDLEAFAAGLRPVKRPRRVGTTGGKS